MRVAHTSELPTKVPKRVNLTIANNATTNTSPILKSRGYTTSSYSGTKGTLIQECLSYYIVV
jgi:hypothetical protein